MISNIGIGAIATKILASATTTETLEELPTLEDVSDQVQNVNAEKIKAFLKDLAPDALNLGLKVVLAFVIYFIGAKIIKFLRKLLQRFLNRANVDEGVKQFLDSFAKVILYFFLIVLICGWFGISTASIVALLGSAGLAVGLALQGSLANFAGGVLILVIKPFKVGDYIVEDTNKNEGTVTEIQLFYTKLTTVDNQIVVIPNGALANSSLTNVTEQEKRRVDISVGISYDADIKQVKELLTDILLNENRRLQEDEMNVFVQELADSSVQMGCRIWVRSQDYWQVKWDLLEEIKMQFDRNGIEIPYNQLTVTVAKQEKDTL